MGHRTFVCTTGHRSISVDLGIGDGPRPGDIFILLSYVMRGHRDEQADLSFLTINVGGPGVDRARRLADFLVDASADVLVLTETRANLGTEQLLDQCRRAGYTVFADLDIPPGERGVAIAHRLGTAFPIRSTSVRLAHRLTAVEVATEPRMLVVGAYVPSRDASTAKITRKQSFLADMQSRLRCWSQKKPVLFLGDLNVVTRDHVPRYSFFRSWEYAVIEDLDSIGLVDVFAQLHPGVQAYSWIGRTGDGYRYDYAFASPPVAERVLACEYLHGPRELGLSDHAALRLSLSRTDVGIAEAPSPSGHTFQPA